VLKDPLISRGCICMDDEVVLLNKGSFIEQYDRRNETHISDIPSFLRMGGLHSDA
jgi:hypothetical protein